MNKSNTTGRLTELDSLRGLAALSVMVFHYAYFFKQRMKYDAIPQFDFNVGETGVDLFFIISGFVILLTLERTKRPVDFIISRLTRLYPTFWVSLTLTVAAVLIFGLPFLVPSFKFIMANYTMVPVFFRLGTFDGVYWSLAVELTFYMLMFGIYLAGALKHIDKIAWAIVLGSVLYKLSYLYVMPNLVSLHYLFGLLRHLPLFMAGITFYQIYTKQFTWARGTLLLVSLPATVFTFDMRHYSADTYWHIGAIIVFYLLFLAIVYNKASWLNLKPLLWLGSISYPLYLLHLNIGFIIIDRLAKVGMPTEVASVIAILFSVILAYIVHIFIEKKASGIVRSALSNYFARKV